MHYLILLLFLLPNIYAPQVCFQNNQNPYEITSLFSSGIFNFAGTFCTGQGQFLLINQTDNYVEYNITVDVSYPALLSYAKFKSEAIAAPTNITNRNPITFKSPNNAAFTILYLYIEISPDVSPETPVSVNIVANRIPCPIQCMYTIPPLCVTNMSDCLAAISSCNKESFQCFDKTCVEIPSNCVSSSIDCGSGKIRCWDGSCRDDLEECPLIRECSQDFPKRCPDGRCIPADGKCSEGKCSQFQITCPDGTCTSPINGACSGYNGCPVGNILCPNGKCVSDRSLCQCPGKQGYLCHDGTCVQNPKNCSKAPFTIKPYWSLYSLSKKDFHSIPIWNDDFSDKLCTLYIPQEMFDDDFFTMKCKHMADSWIREKSVNFKGGSVYSPILDLSMLRGMKNPSKSASIECTGSIPDKNISNVCLIQRNESGHWKCIDGDVNVKISSGVYRMNVSLNQFSQMAFASKSEYSSDNLEAPIGENDVGILFGGGYYYVIATGIAVGVTIIGIIAVYIYQKKMRMIEEHELNKGKSFFAELPQLSTTMAKSDVELLRKM